jgi:hypothetical protein
VRVRHLKRELKGTVGMIQKQGLELDLQLQRALDAPNKAATKCREMEMKLKTLEAKYVFVKKRSRQKTASMHSSVLDHHHHHGNNSSNNSSNNNSNNNSSSNSNSNNSSNSSLENAVLRLRNKTEAAKAKVRCIFYFLSVSCFLNIHRVKIDTLFLVF